MGFLLGLLGGTANVILTTILSLAQSIGGGIMSIAKQGMDAMMQYHDKSIQFARSVGMTYKESQAYANVLIDRASELGIKYGIAADKVMELQENLTKATGRSMMLNNKDAEKFVQINKLVGADTANAFTSTITKNLGGQIHTVTGAVSKAYTTAMKSGLDAATFSKKVADNLSLANRYSFRNGIDGITKMTAMSEKLGVNMDSIAKSMDNFMDLDKAIENSAKLNMLGGAAGAFGSNPLTMAYEANYDPEAFMERAKDTLGGLATFDAKSGTANVNGMNRDFVKSIAEAMGMSMEDAMTMAKKQAEIKYKESQFGGQLSAIPESQRDFVLNKSYVGQDGQLKMTDSQGNERNVSDLQKSGELQKMQNLDNKSDGEIMRDMATQLSTVTEIMTGIKTSLTADAARAFNKVYYTLHDNLGSIGRALQGSLHPLWERLADGVYNIMKYLEDHKGIIFQAIDILKSIISAVVNNFGTVIGILMAGSVLGGGKFLKGGFRAFKTGYRVFRGGLRGGGRMFARASSRFTNTKLGNLGASKGMNFLTGGQSGRIVNSFRNARRVMGMGKLSATAHSIGQGIKGLSKVAKVGGAVSAIMSVAQVASSVVDYSGQKDNLDKQLKSGAISKKDYEAKVTEAQDKRNEGIGSGIGTGVGAAIGTVLGGPVGGFVGGAIGDKVGGYIGKNWNKMSASVSKGFSKFTKWSGEKLGKLTGWAGKKLSGGIEIAKKGANAALGLASKVVKGFFDFVIKWFKFVTIPIKALLSPIQTAKTFWNEGLFSVGKKLYQGKFATGGIIGGDSYHGDKLKAHVNSGEMILTMSQQKKLFDFANSATSLFGGNRSYVKKGVGEKRSLIVAKPVGEKEYIHKPSRSNASENRSIKINDFNINISGTIKLDGGNTSKNIDINKLLSNQEFISSLKDIIKTSINNDINCGKFMNDDALRRGLPAQTALWGRK